MHLYLHLACEGIGARNEVLSPSKTFITVIDGGMCNEIPGWMKSQKHSTRFLPLALLLMLCTQTIPWQHSDDIFQYCLCYGGTYILGILLLCDRPESGTSYVQWPRPGPMSSSLAAVK